MVHLFVGDETLSARSDYSSTLSETTTDCLPIYRYVMLNYANATRTFTYLPSKGGMMLKSDQTEGSLAACAAVRPVCVKHECVQPAGEDGVHCEDHRFELSLDFHETTAA